MPSPDVVIPRMRGMVGNLANTTQAVERWLEECERIMRSDVLKDETDWEFLEVTDIDEAAPAAQIEATTSHIYGILVGMLSTAENCSLVLVDDAGGGYAYNALAAQDATFRATMFIPLATTAGVEEWHSFVFEDGIAMTNDALLAIDGQAGTNLAADNLCRAFVVYRTN